MYQIEQHVGPVCCCDYRILFVLKIYNFVRRYIIPLDGACKAELVSDLCYNNMHIHIIAQAIDIQQKVIYFTYLFHVAVPSQTHAQSHHQVDHNQDKKYTLNLPLTIIRTQEMHIQSRYRHHHRRHHISGVYPHAALSSPNPTPLPKPNNQNQTSQLIPRN